MHAWWMFSCRYPHLGNETSSVVSIMCGSQPRQFQNFTKICKLCPARIKDSAEHILFGCEALAKTHYKYMERVLSSMPPPMRRHFEDMLITEKTMFIVSGLNVKYTDEWSHLYSNIVKFVHNIYEERHDRYKNILLVPSRP